MGRKPASSSVKLLKRAVEIAEQIEKLQAELNSILGGAASVGRPAGIPVAAVKEEAPARRKPRFSAAARARIAAAQRARWAKLKKEKAQGK